jgi:hypothetical protein
LDEAGVSGGGGLSVWGLADGDSVEVDSGAVFDFVSAMVSEGAESVWD